MTQKIRVLMAKPGTDGHDWGARVVMTGLRDAGMEVIYCRFVSPQEIVKTAIQEGVDVVGISILNGAHLTVLRKVMKLLTDEGEKDTLVFLGGIIPTKHVPLLKEMGIAEVFGPGTKIDTIVSSFEEHVAKRKS